jgi:hypothetical protein
LAKTHDDHPLGGQRFLLDAAGGEQGGEGGSAGALDVVVEGGDALAVALQ